MKMIANWVLKVSTIKKGLFWSNFFWIKIDNIDVPFVKCKNCSEVYSFNKKNGTSTISKHKCKKSNNNDQPLITDHLVKRMPKHARKSMLIESALTCAIDMRSFSLFSGKFYQIFKFLIFI